MEGAGTGRPAAVTLRRTFAPPGRRSTTMATPATPCLAQQTTGNPTLLLAFAWGENPWQLGGTTGAAPRPRARQGAAGDVLTVCEAIRRAKHRGGLPEHTRVVRGDEAGRDGRSEERRGGEEWRSRWSPDH